MIDKRIHYSRLLEIMQRTNADGSPKPFSFTYIKRDGKERIYKNAVLSSFHAGGDTVNIIPSGELRPKKFVRILITHINNTKVYL